MIHAVAAKVLFAISALLSTLPAREQPLVIYALRTQYLPCLSTWGDGQRYDNAQYDVFTSACWQLQRYDLTARDERWILRSLKPI